MDQQLKDTPSAAQGIPMPALGAALADGVFAGIVRSESGDVALVDLGFIVAGRGNWKRASELASEKGAALPTREEARVLWANLDSRSTENRGWFWTSTQHADYESYAWIQYFVDGNQYYGHKDDEYYVRAVRRLPLQSFGDSK